MTKEFRISVVVIVILCSIFGYRDHIEDKNVEHRQSEYKAKQESDYQKTAILYRQFKDTIDFKNRIIKKIISELKPSEVKNTEDEEDALVGYIGFLSAKKKDSIARAKGDPAELVNKMNHENTVIFFYDKLNGDSVDIALLIHKLITSEKDGNYNMYSARAFDFRSDSATRIIKRVAALQYLAVIQETVHKEPKMHDKDSFEQGFTVFKLSVFDVYTAKKVKEADIVATSSDKVRTMSVAGGSEYSSFALSADLERECRKAIAEIVYGEKPDLINPY